MITLWGGSAGTEPLSYGVGRVDVVEYDEATGGLLEDKEISSLDLENAGSSESSNELGTSSSNENDNVAHTKKRKLNCVPKLIDNKRKHLQRSCLQPRGTSYLLKKLRKMPYFRRNWLTQCKTPQKAFPEVLKVLVRL